MNTKSNKTWMLKDEEVDSQWFLIDASGKTLGRLASEIATVLRGKHKPTYTPHVCSGDGVIVINAKGVKVTGKKESQKIYRHYTGYPGGQRQIPYARMMERKPTEIIRLAVKGMLPRNRQSRKQLRRLRIFAEGKHHMQAQQPIPVNC